MKAESRHARTVFLQAVETVAPENWSAFVVSECGGDEKVLREVQRLLEAHIQVQSFMSEPAEAMVAETAEVSFQPKSVRVGERIGRYRLMEQIGVGGMGVVFVAEQTEPVRRKVALKIIKPGMDSREVLGRFSAEQQALAMMEHPNIAKVFDAGCTESGLPYFVMELVRGSPITEFCDNAKLPVVERLKLFTSVCHAVQHAHLKGIIHRDLKPSNVLVTLHDSEPVVKIIDFGVAKAINQQLSQLTVYTAHTQMIGTPLYMSPEQAELSGLDVDTRSDVYSLGVMLYELLTSRTPFDSDTLRKAGLDEMRRIIREQEPLLPSRRISTLDAETISTASKKRGLDERRLAPMLQGELDWIVMKALEKNRTRRYESASAFAADIDRYLNHEAVQAGPPSTLYRMRKFAGRNRVFVAVASGLFIVFFMLAAGVGWVVGDRINRRVETAKTVARMLEESLQLQRQSHWREAQAVLQGVDELLTSAGGDREILDRFRQVSSDVKMLNTIENASFQPAFFKSAQNPGSEYSPVEASMFAAFQEYGIPILELSPREATSRIEDSAISQELLIAIVDLTTMTTNEARGEQLSAIAKLAAQDPKWKELFEVVSHRNLMELRRLVQRPDILDSSSIHLRVLCGPIARLLAINDPDTAVVLLRKAQERFPADFWVNYYLALALRNVEPPHLEQAVSCYRVALAIRPDSPLVHNKIGITLCDYLHDYVGAELAFREALRLQPDSVMHRANLAECLQNMGKNTEAMELYREIIAIDPNSADAYCNLAQVLTKLGKHQEALQSIQRGHELGSAKPNWQHDSAKWVRECEVRAQLDVKRDRFTRSFELPESLQETAELAEFCFADKNTPELALRFYRSVFARQPSWEEMGGLRYHAACAAAILVGYETRLIPDSSRVNKNRDMLSMESLGWLRAELEFLQKRLKSEEENVSSKLRDIVVDWQQDVRLLAIREPDALLKLSEQQRVEWQRFWKDVESFRENVAGLTEAAAAWDNFVMVSKKNGRDDELIAYAEARRTVSEAIYGVDHPKTWEAMSRLAEAYNNACHWDAAAKTMEQLVKARQPKLGLDHPETFKAILQLGNFYRMAGKWSESDLQYRTLAELSSKTLGPDHQDTLQYEFLRVSLLSAEGRIQEAIPQLEKFAETRRTRFGSDHPSTLTTMTILVYAYFRDGRHDQLDPMVRDLIDRRKKEKTFDKKEMAILNALLGMNLLSQKRYSEARTILQESLDILQGNRQLEWQRFRITNLLGAAQAGLGENEPAEALLVDGYEGLCDNEAKIPVPWRWYVSFAGESVVNFYEATGASEKADLWRKKVAMRRTPNP